MYEDDTQPHETEADKVEGWRLHVLLEAGFPVTAAQKLAAAPHADLHRAVELVESGCSHELAAEILL